MTLYFNKTPIDSGLINDALRFYPVDEFDSPHCSTVALLSWLKHEPQAVAATLRKIGVPEQSNRHLEYTVHPPEGRGKSSQTDLMLLAGDIALAVEAKWTESRDHDIKKWLALGAGPENRLNVLAGWLGEIQRHCPQQTVSEEFQPILYQMVQRAASACLAGNKPMLAYLLFTPSPLASTSTVAAITKELSVFWDMLGNPAEFPFFVVEVVLTPTQVFETLSKLPKGDEQTAVAVKAALTLEQLFVFRDPVVTRIGG